MYPNKQNQIQVRTVADSSRKDQIWTIFNQNYHVQPLRSRGLVVTKTGSVGKLTNHSFCSIDAAVGVAFHWAIIRMSSAEHYGTSLPLAERGKPRTVTNAFKRKQKKIWLARYKWDRRFNFQAFPPRPPTRLICDINLTDWKTFHQSTTWEPGEFR